MPRPAGNAVMMAGAPITVPQPPSPGRSEAHSNFDDVTETPSYLLKFIDYRHEVSQTHLEQQNAQLLAKIEDMMDQAVSDLRLYIAEQLVAQGDFSSDSISPKNTRQLAGAGTRHASTNGFQPSAAVPVALKMTDDTTRDTMGSDQNGLHVEKLAELTELKDQSYRPSERDLTSEQEDANTEGPDGTESGYFATGRSAIRKLSRNSKQMSTIARFVNNEKPKTQLVRFLDGPCSAILAIAIVFSTIATYVELEVSGSKANQSLGLTSSIFNPKALLEFFDIMEYPLAGFFLIDMGLRLYAFGPHILMDTLGFLDGVIAVASALETFILRPAGIIQGGANLEFIRMVRYAKLVRVLRAVGMFGKVRVLVNTIAASVTSLFWSMIILLCLQLMAALMLTQLLHSSIVDDRFSDEFRLWINSRYGSPSKSWWTMFEVTFAGNWPTHVRPLIEHVSPWYAMVFGGFITFVVFDIIRVIAAIFLKETLEESAKDAEMAVLGIERQRAEFAAALKDIFEEADSDGNGELCWTQFNTLLQHPKVRMYLSTVGLDFHDEADVRVLFDFLDDGNGHDGTISFDEFSSGFVRLQGQARSLDIYSIRNAQAKLRRDVHQMSSHLKLVARAIGAAGMPKQ